LRFFVVFFFFFFFFFFFDVLVLSHIACDLTFFLSRIFFSWLAKKKRLPVTLKRSSNSLVSLINSFFFPAGSSGDHYHREEEE